MPWPRVTVLSTPPPPQIAIHTLWNIRIVVLAKPEHENRISHICTDNVKTGIANTLGEQGGARAHGVILSEPTRTSLCLASWVTGVIGSPSLHPPGVYTSAARDLAKCGF